LLISLGIISSVLIYYYWDSISEFIFKFKILKPDGDGPDIDNTPTIRDIQLNDLTSNQKVDIDSMDLGDITNFHEKLNINCKEIINQINNITQFLEENSNLTNTQKIKINTDFKSLFEQLKHNQISQIEIFNKLTQLKLEDGIEILKYEDKINLLKNINSIHLTLNKHGELLPDYNLNLQDLPELNVEINRPLSPFKTATIQLEDLNTSVEKSWSNDKISPQSDDSDHTVKAVK